jgi:hypothetical protein
MVPVHLAFDLAEALGAAPSNNADPAWVLLAKLSGHQAPTHDDDHHHHPPHCPVCSALGALGGLAAPATPPRLLPPPAPAGAPAVLQSEEWFNGGAVAAYRSRAPPTT